MDNNHKPDSCQERPRRQVPYKSKRNPTSLLSPKQKVNVSVKIRYINRKGFQHTYNFVLYKNHKQELWDGYNWCADFKKKKRRKKKEEGKKAPDDGQRDKEKGRSGALTFCHRTSLICSFVFP